MNNTAITIKVTRGPQIESLHEVSALVLNHENKILKQYGDVDQKIYPRSSIKSVQAVSIILSGAHEKFKISDIELALASASHNAEAEHVNAVSNWLKRLGLNVEDLQCGAHLPFNQNALIQLLNQNQKYTAIHNNCSGKHTGMLATALALNSKTKNYIDKNHPVQLFIKNIIEKFSDEKITDDCIAIDGCSIPTYYMSMQSLARCMARFAHPIALPIEYQAACARIYKAAVENPFYVAGTARYCTDMMSELQQKALIKTGAEGVMFASIPSLKAGVVVKAKDGGTRAAEAAMSFLLKDLGLLNSEKFLNTPISNWNGITTGQITAHI